MRVIVLLILLAETSTLFAQSEQPSRFEAGPILMWSEPSYLAVYRSGFGGRAVVNVNRWLGGEIQVLANTDTSRVAAHAKLTWRVEQHRKLNLFAIAGPGRLRQVFVGSRGIDDIENYLIIDAGGGVEVVPSKRFAIRLDALDAAVRRTTLYSPVSGSPLELFTLTNHVLNLQIGLVLRFSSNRQSYAP